MGVSEQPLIRAASAQANIRAVSPGLKAWHASLFGNTLVMI